MEVKISVIMPVYNAEKYLRQSIDSVLKQNIDALEVICVDDGSSDNSAEVICQYALNDRRIIYIQQKNSGAGSARNKALDFASGEYILFMDADDMLIPESLGRLYEEAVKLKADVIRCKALDYDNNNYEIRSTLHNALERVPFFLFGTSVSFKMWYWLFPKLNVAPWGGLFRREFLAREKIRFNDLVCVNDRSFYWESVLKSKCTAFSKTELVYYRTNISDSLVGNRIRNFDCHFKSYDIIEKMLDGLPIRIKRCILNGELLDIANWAEKAAQTELRDKVLNDVQNFIMHLNKAPWGGNINQTKWYKRIELL